MGRWPPLAPRLAWVIWALTVAIIVTLWTTLIAPRVLLAADATLVFPPLGGTLFILTTATVGALVAARRPRNPIGWLFVAAGLCWAVGSAGTEYGMTAAHAERAELPGADLAAWLSAWLLPTVGGVLLTVVPLLYPNGRLLTQRWRWVARASVLSLVLLSAGVAFSPGELLAGLFVLPRNPLGAEGVWFPAARTTGAGLLIVCGVLAVSSVVVRFRSARGIERQQIKWLALASAVLGVEGTAVTTAYMVLGLVPVTPAYTVLATTTVLASASVPAAVGLALLRYRLYEIDRLINRTLVYAALTAVLALVYWGGVALLQGLLRPLTGGSELAIVGSTLLVAMLFQPARRRIQTGIDQRFYRPRYDAQRTLARFNTHLRDEVNLDILQGELLRVVHVTMEPASVSLWLRQGVKVRGSSRSS